jgi:microcystin degradation protein MlrC
VISLRIATGTISHETNTFCAYPTTLDNFKHDRLAPRSVKTGYLDAKDFLEEFSGTKSVAGGFIDASKNLGFELVPTIWANATPGGTVTSETFDYLLSALLKELQNVGKVDGVLLGLHGGGYSEIHNDLEGKVLKDVREIIGEHTPLATVFDLHANVSQLRIDTADFIVGYDTYPHVDMYERAFEAADIMVSTIKGKMKPTMAMEKPPLIPPLQAQFTGRHPMNKIMDLAHKIEQEKGILNVTVSASFPLTDAKDTAMSLIVTSDNNMNLAKTKAKTLSDMTWSLRKDFLVTPTPIDKAVKEAMSSPGPTVLADIGDNPGAGGSTDGTALIRALIKANAKNTVVAVIRDPEAVSKAVQTGVGNRIIMKIGGKTDKLHGDPLEVTGYIRLISDGMFRNRGPMGAGMEVRLGKTVVLDCNGVEVILTELRYQPTDLQIYRSLGIEPSEKQTIVVKSSVHFRAAHGPIAKKIMEVDTPGVTGPDLKRYPFKKVKRPVFPLDEI